MTTKTPQCEVFWALLLNPKHSGVSEDSKSQTLGVLGFTPTLGQSGVVTMANTQATKEAIWITKLMMDLGYMEEKKVMVIRCDNQGAISLTKNPTHHARTKHIDVQHHFV